MRAFLFLIVLIFCFFLIVWPIEILDQPAIFLYLSVAVPITFILQRSIWLRLYTTKTISAKGIIICLNFGYGIFILSIPSIISSLIYSSSLLPTIPGPILWVLVHAVFALILSLHKYIPLSLEGFTPHTLVFGIMKLYITHIQKDEFIVDFKDISQLFDSIWGPELERQGFIRLPNYQVKPQKGEYYFTALWLKDTGQGYTYYVLCDQSEDSKLLDIRLRVEPNVPNYTKNKKKIKWKEYYFQKILLDVVLSYRKSIVSYHLSSALTQWNQNNFFTQFSTLPKPFDTIRPRDFKENPQLIKDFLSDSFFATLNQCLTVIALTAIKSKDKQLLQECIDELDNSHIIKDIIHMAKEHHMI